MKNTQDSPEIVKPLTVNQLLYLFIVHIRKYLDINSKYYNPFQDDLPLEEQIRRICVNRRNMSLALESEIGLENISQDIPLNIDASRIIANSPNILTYLLSFIELIKKMRPDIEVDQYCKQLLVGINYQDEGNQPIEQNIDQSINNIDNFNWENPKIITRLKSLAEYFFEVMRTELEINETNHICLYDFTNNFIVACLFYSENQLNQFITQPLNSSNPLTKLSWAIIKILLDYQVSQEEIYGGFSVRGPIFQGDPTLRIPKITEFDEKILGLSISTLSGQQVTFRLFDLDTANKLSRRFHMMHCIGGGIQKYALGAFLENDDMPYIFATLNQSEPDKPYIKALCEKYALNPQALLEISRSWSHINTPKYHLGVFYSVLSQLSVLFQQKYGSGSGSTRLNGLYTTINPNIGFRANAYRGNGYKVVAQRQSGFQYVLVDDVPVPSYLLRGNSEYEKISGAFACLPNNVLLKNLTGKSIRGSIIVEG